MDKDLTVGIERLARKLAVAPGSAHSGSQPGGNGAAELDCNYTNWVKETAIELKDCHDSLNIYFLKVKY